MNETGPRPPYKTLDRDLDRFSQLEAATAYVARPLVAPGMPLPSF